MRYKDFMGAVDTLNEYPERKAKVLELAPELKDLQINQIAAMLNQPGGKSPA